MDNTNEKKNRNMLYWLCRELLACLGWGAALFTVIVVAISIIALIANINEPIVAPVVMLAASGLLLAIIAIWAYGYFKARRKEQSATDKREWNKFVIVLFKALIGLVIIVACVVFGIAIVGSVEGLIRPIHWLIVSVVCMMLLCTVALWLLFVIDRKWTSCDINASRMYWEATAYEKGYNDGYNAAIEQMRQQK